MFESMTFSRTGPFVTNVGAKRLDSCSHWLGLPTSASAKAQSSRSVGILRVRSKRRRLARGGGGGQNAIAGGVVLDLVEHERESGLERGVELGDGAELEVPIRSLDGFK